MPILAHSWLGHLYLAQGDLEHAIQVLEPGLALCRASGSRNQLRQMAATLGYAFALQGRLAEGRVLLEEGSSEHVRTGGLTGQAYRVAWLSEVCRLAGCGEEARAALSTAVEMYRAMAMTLWLPQAEAALAQTGEAARPAGGVP